jgi:hypothetical protein
MAPFGATTTLSSSSSSPGGTASASAVIGRPRAALPSAPCRQFWGQTENLPLVKLDAY